MAEVARRTDLDRATVRRLVLTLEHLGYVRRIGRSFRATPKVLLLATGFLQSRQLTRTVVPILNQFSREIEAPIYFAMRDEFDAVFLAHSALESSAISLGFTIGSRLPVLSTSIGRALLACGPLDDVEAVISSAPLDRFTDRTLLDRAAIVQAVARVRDQGFAYVDGEFEPGVAAIAMPLPETASFSLAIGMSAERDAFTQSYVQQVVRTLRSCRQCMTDAVKLL